MAIECPLCELSNDDAALECAQCGRALLTFSEGGADVAPIEGLTLSSFSGETARAQADEVVEGLEQTRFDPVRLAAVEALPVEQTALAQEPGRPLAFEPGTLELETGREADDGARTAAPEENGSCPYCGVVSAGKLCDGCGRRRTRYAAAPATAGPALRRQRRDGDDDFCPNCFGKIVWAAKCPECGVPLPLRELL